MGYRDKPRLRHFLFLIQEGLLTVDWRAIVKLDGTGCRDRGTAFRIYRSELLFGPCKTIWSEEYASEV